MNGEKLYLQYMYSYPHKRTYEMTERLDLAPYRDAFVGRAMGLYVHIPFCRSKCGYCNLFSIVDRQDAQHAQYLDAVKRHSAQMKREVDFEHTDFRSLTLGGGTPMLLSAKHLEELLDFCGAEYDLDLPTVFSCIETSPSTTDEEKLALLRERDFKRISIGVQSFVEQELLLLERGEKPSDCRAALEKIKRADFDSLNIDLIYGMPNQTERSFLDSLSQAMYFEPDEIFLYPLYKQPNARLYRKFELDAQKQYRLYQIGRDYLLSQGYRQLSMRSFAKRPPSNADCGYENTLSLGCGGRSYFDELHFCERYVAGKEESEALYRRYVDKRDFLADISFFLLDREERKRKYAIKNLLYATGLSKADYRRHFGSEAHDDFDFLHALTEQGYLYETPERIFLTTLGYGHSDRIGPMLMSEAVAEKMKSFEPEA